MATQLKIDTTAILARVRANLAALRSCPRHLFNPPVTVTYGEKHRCQNCGGEMDLRDVGNYLDGFKSAGRDPNEIWPGWNKPQTPKE